MTAEDSLKRIKEMEESQRLLEEDIRVNVQFDEIDRVTKGLEKSTQILLDFGMNMSNIDASNLSKAFNEAFEKASKARGVSSDFGSSLASSFKKGSQWVNDTSLKLYTLASISLSDLKKSVVADFQACADGAQRIQDEVNRLASMSPTELTVTLAKGFMHGALKAKALGVEVKNFLASAPSKFADGLSNGLTNSVNLLRELGVQARDVAASGIAHTFVGLGKGLIAGVNGMNQLGQGALDFISTGINSAVGGLANGITAGVKAMGQLGQGALDLVCSGANEFGNQLAEGLAVGSDAMVNLCKQAASFASTSIANVGNKLSNGLKIATNWITQIDQKTIQFGKKIFAIGKAKISQGFAKMGAIVNKVKASVSKLGKASKNAGRLEKLSDFFKLRDIAEAIKTKLDMAKAKQAELKNKATQTAAAMSKVKANASGIDEPLNRAKISLQDLKNLASNFGSVKEDLKKVFDLADSITQNKSQLNAMNDGLYSTEELQNCIYQAAQRSRSSYGELSSQVVDLSSASKGIFANNGETVAFAELMNKSFAIGKLNAEDQASAMSQVTQSMNDGVVSGEAMKSILSGAPALADTLASKYGASNEELMRMAEAGEICAGALKNSMFASADATNEQFTQIPMTFQELWTMILEGLMQTFRPIIEFIAGAATWIATNWSALQPVIFGLAAAVGIFAMMLGIKAIAAKIATLAHNGLIKSLLASPLMWIALIIGVVIGFIYKWVQSVGGLKVAWLIVMDKLKTTWANFVAKFKEIGHKLMQFFLNIKLGWLRFRNAIVGFVLDMGVNVLTGIENMINGAIRLINKFISVLNGIEGVSIEPISEVTFAAEAAAAAELKKQAMADEVTELENQINDADRAFRLQQRLDKAKAINESFERQKEIEDAKAVSEGNAKVPVTNSIEKKPKKEEESSGGGMARNTAETAANTEAMKNSMDTAVEELAYLRDLAEQEAINRFTTAEIKIDMTNNNNIGSDMDIDGIVEQLEDKLGSAMLSAAEGVPA